MHVRSRRYGLSGLRVGELCELDVSAREGDDRLRRSLEVAESRLETLLLGKPPERETVAYVADVGAEGVSDGELLGFVVAAAATRKNENGERRYGSQCQAHGAASLCKAADRARKEAQRRHLER